MCTVHFPYPDGHLVPLSFDVEVQPIGCYTATGPPAVVGQLTLTSPAGRFGDQPAVRLRRVPRHRLRARLTGLHRIKDQ